MLFVRFNDNQSLVVPDKTTGWYLNKNLLT
jgi:hypothetical protein